MILKGAPNRRTSSTVLHLATAGGSRLCTIAFHDDIEFVAGAMQERWTVVTSHEINCSRCRVVNDWACEHAVKQVTRWFAFKKAEAKRIAKMLGTTATQQQSKSFGFDGRWGVVVSAFDGRALSVRLAMAGDPFRKQATVDAGTWLMQNGGGA